MRLYLSGPMRGIPMFNFPLFDAVAADLRAQGHTVISPVDHDREVDPDCETRDGFDIGQTNDDYTPFEELLGWDLEMISRPGNIEGIVLLPGWESSTGAAHELYVAKLVGKQVFYAALSLLGEWRSLNEPRWVLCPHVEPVVIGLAGYAQAGKDTVGNILVEDYGFERRSFAGAMKEMLYRLNPMTAVTPRGEDYGVSLGSLIDQVGWETAKAFAPQHEFGVRAYLQRLGTEAGREVLGEDIWVDTALRDLRPGGKYVITDVRFPNELAAVKRLGGHVWRVLRPGTDPVNGHVSETALDGETFDALLINEGTVDDLVHAVAYVMLYRRDA